MAQFGKLDILVNNAAIAVQGKTVDDPDLDTVNLDRQWQINVMGAVATTRAAAPVLSDGGRIIFIGSLLGGHVPFPGVADYAGTKAAIAGYAKGVARDLGGRNITVNIVQPGIMPTDMAAEVPARFPDAIMDMHPIRRIATLEEVSAIVCFLAGPNGGLHQRRDRKYRRWCRNRSRRFFALALHLRPPGSRPRSLGALWFVRPSPRRASGRHGDREIHPPVVVFATACRGGASTAYEGYGPWRGMTPCLDAWRPALAAEP